MALLLLRRQLGCQGGVAAWIQRASPRRRRVLRLGTSLPNPSFRLHSTALSYKDEFMAEDELERIVDHDATKGPVLPSDPAAEDPSKLRLFSPHAPSGDQPAAIAQLSQYYLDDTHRFALLHGATGTGKTMVMAHLMAQRQQTVVVLAHNKTLAAQLARELRSCFGADRVHLFVSYYTHYVPESFAPTTGRYVAKKSAVAAELDALRHCATRALLTQDSTVLVCSVSCLYGMGLPSEYVKQSWELRVGETSMMTMMVDDTVDGENKESSSTTTVLTPFERLEKRLLYTLATDTEFGRGQYQPLSDTSVLVWPPQEAQPVLLEWNSEDDGLLTNMSYDSSGNDAASASLESLHLFPAQHHVVSPDRLQSACTAIETELQERVAELRAQDNTAAAERLSQRVMTDLYLLRETGTCAGIENYSRHLSHRAPGSTPSTLLDYLPDNKWWLIVDESHVTIPQIKAMYYGDRKRKESLVAHGYRLPSALDNRPLKDTEFWSRVPKALFVSATPGKTELEWIAAAAASGGADDTSSSAIATMEIRPTFVPDPVVHVVQPQQTDQLQDLVERIRQHRPERTLALVLTKRDAEDLSRHLRETMGIPSDYLHSGLTTQERSDALKRLQQDEIWCLVGVNCLREGLDLPEVSLVAVLNADAKGFLRSESALLQIIGRAARNTNGTAVLYANEVTDAMQRCMDITDRRRAKQIAYNEKHQHTMRSTESSSMLSIFDLAQDQIRTELEAAKLEVSGGNPLSNGRHPLPTRKVSISADSTIETKHIPSSPGVYFWKDANDKILYIGKAVKLRNRVKSYLTTRVPSRRIKVMLEKATHVEFILTPSERDALVLESNLVKYHQPPFNVLLKDDEHYPYLCATTGDDVPELKIVPRREANSKHRYFGPYTNFREIYDLLDGIEEKYDLRGNAFLVRHGSMSKDDYLTQFDVVMAEVFSNISAKAKGDDLMQRREQYEEAGLLFDSDHNQCRDVVAVATLDDPSIRSKTSLLVHVAQLRKGIVAGQFSYVCQLPGKHGDLTDQDFGEAIQTVLSVRHYPAGNGDGGYQWMPEEILTAYKVPHLQDVKKLFGKAKVSVRTAAKSGKKKAIDSRVLEFANNNAEQAAREKADYNIKALVDGTGAAEIADMLGMDTPPSRIECYDVSHTQGEFTSASRIVFLDGKPAPSLYRNFNIRTAEGSSDDYASLQEVLGRRLKRLATNTDDEAWARPDLLVIDGGKGQLGAVVDVLNQAQQDIPICSIAKREEEVFGRHSNHPVNQAMDLSAPGMLLLRAVRDESHRVALRAHRSRRSILKQ